MSTTPPVTAPAGYVPLMAIASGTLGDTATAADAAHPLPVRAFQLPSGIAPLAGSTAVPAAAGPFVPQLGRPIIVTLSGSWTGTVQLLRSTDGGATRLPLTYGDGSPKAIWTGNLNAAVAEENVAGATYFLDVALTGGTLTYRMEQ